MAVARAPVGGGMNSTKVALIVFVCLTVASLACAVILFTRQADNETAAKTATEQGQKASADKAKMQQDMGEFARLLTGESNIETDKIQKTVSDAIAPIIKDPALAQARVTADATVMSILKGVYGLYKSNTELLAKTTAERDELNKKVADLNQAAEQKDKDFQFQTTSYSSRISTLEQQNAANQQAWTQQLTELKGRLESSTTVATASLGKERQMRQDLEKQMEQTKSRSTELAEKLAKFQPGMDNVSPEQIADGQIVRTAGLGDIVYISLGNRDRITAGMPFTVYSKGRAGAPMHEKATIEVRNIYDNTSECRVTSSKPNDPIIEGDIIANLVYDKNHKYRFVVSGDFDLDFDGKIDQPGGQSGQDVINMIQRWGGEVVQTVDSSIDFVVLGSPPSAPVKPPNNASDDVKLRAAEQQQVRNSFDAIRAESKSLSIPVLTRTQFLHFIGMKVPPRTPEDRLAGQ